MWSKARWVLMRRVSVPVWLVGLGIVYSVLLPWMAAVLMERNQRASQEMFDACDQLTKTTIGMLKRRHSSR